MKKEVQELRNMPRSDITVQKEELVSTVLDEWLARDELLWKQRARMTG